VDLSIERDGKQLDKTLQLFEKKEIRGYYTWYKREKNGKSFKILDDNIGYITLKNIKKDDIVAIKSELKDTKGIIVDIRNYPSTFVPFLLGNFLNSNRADFVKFTQGNANNPGEFIFRKGLKVGLNRSWSYQGNKVIVLVNEISQSQAEYTAMAFKAGDKTTIIGSTTAGADGNVSRITLPGGLRTAISGIGVYYPDGTETQRIGIIPDIEVLPTIKGIKEGRDEVLEKAIEIINKND
jgi:C-terminal processing protease CtpA/Prc